MAANLASSLAALGAPSSGAGNQGGGAPAPAPKLPPKKRHRPECASSASAGPLRVGENMLRATAEGRCSSVLQTVFQHPASSVIAVTSKGQPAGFVVNARFMAEVQSQQQLQRQRIEALQFENERLRRANAALGRAAPPPGAQPPHAQ